MAGEQFELDVYKAVEEILYAEKLGIVPSCCKLFHHKGYYSKDRDSEIITDISIEIYMPNASMPHIIWVWECKDYAEPAPVRVAEEFHSKLEQIGADRTKGTLVTKNGFQRATMQYAISKGIGLARFKNGIAFMSSIKGPPMDVIIDAIKHGALVNILANTGDEWITSWFSTTVVGLTSRGRLSFGLDFYASIEDELKHWGIVPETVSRKNGLWNRVKNRTKALLKK